jgi:hypothetical protein
LEIRATTKTSSNKGLALDLSVINDQEEFTESFFLELEGSGGRSKRVPIVEEGARKACETSGLCVFVHAGHIEMVQLKLEG